MTDEEAIDWVCTLFEIRPGYWAKLVRNGCILLALPPTRLGALRALRLYQPQRAKARATVAALRIGAGLGLHRWLLPALRYHGGVVALDPDFPRAIPCTTGILLGSPEHRVRRAVASYRTTTGWEVAKVAFGGEGAKVLEGEAGILEKLNGRFAGIPNLLGIHQGKEVTLIRLPYLTGRRIRMGDCTAALELLMDWITRQPARQAAEFPEWPAIDAALAEVDAPHSLHARLLESSLVPAVRHGDFARWNLLKQADGSLAVLDWEWGHEAGMPGLDLAHYFLQDARLVKRLPPADAITETLQQLGHPACVAYLKRTGWRGDPILPIIASLAYKQGAGHQENENVLKAAVARKSR